MCAKAFFLCFPEKFGIGAKVVQSETHRQSTLSEERPLSGKQRGGTGEHSAPQRVY